MISVVYHVTNSTRPAERLVFINIQQNRAALGLPQLFVSKLFNKLYDVTLIYFV